jgi:hypothetical protein
MKVGVPLSAVFLLIAWVLLTRVFYPTKIAEIAGGRRVIQDELDKLGPMSRGEWNVLVVFVGTAALWVFREQIVDFEPLTNALPFMANLSDASIAIVAAVALFLIPTSVRKAQGTLDWRTAQSGLPWGVLLLFGGERAVNAETHLGRSAPEQSPQPKHRHARDRHTTRFPHGATLKVANLGSPTIDRRDRMDCVSHTNPADWGESNKISEFFQIGIRGAGLQSDRLSPARPGIATRAGCKPDPRTGVRHTISIASP